jgi:hypothetical protein
MPFTKALARSEARRPFPSGHWMWTECTATGASLWGIIGRSNGSASQEDRIRGPARRRDRAIRSGRPGNPRNRSSNRDDLSQLGWSQRTDWEIFTGGSW